MIEPAFDAVLRQILTDKLQKETTKGRELVITSIKPAHGDNGPRYTIQGMEGREFIKMNSNAYLGFSLHPDVIASEEEAARHFGAGPGSVRFIHGTYSPHKALEQKLADFHAKEEVMLFSSAYMAMIGLIPALTTQETKIISDELNHNCIISAIRLSKPHSYAIYKHADMHSLEESIKQCISQVKRLILITDGIFSMRGDHAPLASICQLVHTYESLFPEGIITIVDDSHGVGVFGATGRGTIEYTGASTIDILVGTLGKAFGVNGGYIASRSTIISYLRETAATYIYSNPITPAEALAGLKSLQLIDSEYGLILLKKIRSLTKLFQNGLRDAGFEIIQGDHPIVPLLVRDTKKTKKLVRYLLDHDILATGLAYPVVPHGDEEIRFQISSTHTEKDITSVLSVLNRWNQLSHSDK